MSFHGYERKVLDLYDEGLSRDEIIARSGLAKATVDSVIARLGRAGEPSRFDKAIPLANAAFVAALRKHHPDRCAA